jgi:excinuclease ABC subunit A
VRCPACDGSRFRPEVLEVKLFGRDIAALLDLPASEVSSLFQSALDADSTLGQPRGTHARKVVRALQPLIDIGLGYLSLSQPAPTLSGASRSG